MLDCVKYWWKTRHLSDNDKAELKKFEAFLKAMDDNGVNQMEIDAKAAAIQKIYDDVY